MKDWPHQTYGIAELSRSIDREEESVAFTSPTGGGKTRIITGTIEHALSRDLKVAIYSNRILLTEQLTGQLGAAGIPFGVRAAGFDELRNDRAQVQICSVQTEDSRVLRRRKPLIEAGTGSAIAQSRHPLWDADVVIVDEAHMQKAAVAEQIMREHTATGTRTRIHVTATPLGISHLCNRLIVAGNNQQLRDCGALLQARMYACEEMDTSKIERLQTGEFSIQGIRKKVWSQAIIGAIRKRLLEYNPGLRPTILFAPGVQESIAVAQELESHGIPAASIDGDDVYVAGERHKSSRDVRQQVLDDIRCGTIKVVCNRFVLREAIDIPELYCCVLATPIGSLLSYVQVVGRVLRNHASLDDVVIIDHGGCWWRHGSPNANREDVWREHFDDPLRIATDIRLEEMRAGKEAQPLVCPGCGRVQMLMRSGKCYQCQMDLKGVRTRKIIERDGTMTEVTGLPVKVRTESSSPTMADAWKRAYYVSKAKGLTFSQARGMIVSGHLRGFEQMRGKWPSQEFALTPRCARDWFRKVKDVNVRELR